MTFAQILRMLSRDVSITKVELTAAPPFVNMVFETQDIRHLPEAFDTIRDIVTLHFIRRQVMWMDIAKEEPQYVLASLETAEKGLDTQLHKLIEKAGPDVSALATFVRSWATACALARKDLRRTLDDIDAEKAQILGYDSAGEDRDEALRDALVLLRKTVYPLIYALIEVLPKDDGVRQQALAIWKQGLDFIRDADVQRSAIPDWDEHQAA